MIAVGFTSIACLYSWGIILYRTLCYIIEGGNSIGLKNGAPGLHDKIGLELQVYQTLAFLEVYIYGAHPSLTYSITGDTLRDWYCTIKCSFDVLASLFSYICPVGYY